MKPLKIVIIGAGSASFAVTSLVALLREPALRGSTLALVDSNPDNLCQVRRLAGRIRDEWQTAVSILATHDRRTVLEGADFVVCAIEVGPREERWRQDWEVPLAHGLRQPYGENGGPGGFAHAARNIPPVLDIAQDMERVCPQATLIVLTNPLPRICRAVTKYTSLRVVGLCHQINFGYALAGVLLLDRTGIDVPQQMITPHPPPFPYDPNFWISVGEYLQQVGEAIEITAAGLNHFSWMLDVRDRRTGEDVYPLLRERFLAFPDGPERLTRDMLRLTGYLPVPGDIHLSEYLPYTHNPATRPWERYQLRPYDWERALAGRKDLRRRMERLGVADGCDLERLRTMPGDGLCDVIVGMAGCLDVPRPSVNVPNAGAIANLPPHAIVEVPGTATARGVIPHRVGPLPRVVAELCRREAELVELVVDAAVQGDPDLALQALALDPTIDDLDVARAVLRDYLQVHGDALPQFAGRWRFGRITAGAGSGRSTAAATSPATDQASGGRRPPSASPAG